MFFKRILFILGIYREYFVLALLLLLSVFLLQLNDNPQINEFRATSANLIGSFNSLLFSYDNLLGVRNENERLKKRNAELASENNMLKESLLENIRLRQMLQFRKKSRFKLISAEILGKPSDKGISSVVINVGEENGVEKNDVAITDRGLVGKVIATRAGYSMVEIVMDRTFRVAARIQRLRVDGIARWSGNLNECYLEAIPKSFQVKPGDVVETSGYSQIYPPDIRIGVITEVSDDVAGIFKHVVLKTDVDFSTLEELFVIVNKRSDFPEFELE